MFNRKKEIIKVLQERLKTKDKIIGQCIDEMTNSDIRLYTMERKLQTANDTIIHMFCQLAGKEKELERIVNEMILNINYQL